MEQKLVSAFEEIAAHPGIGHLREDLLPDEVYFLHVRPYMVIYLRDTSPTVIIGVIHGAMDIPTIIQPRLT